MLDDLGNDLLGPLCAFGSSFTWAIGTTNYARLTQRYSPFAVNFTRALVALPLFLICEIFMMGGISQGLSSFQSVNFSHLFWYTLSIVASYGIGDILFLKSSQSLGIPAALAIGSSYPIFTALVGCLFENQILGWIPSLGLILSTFGIALVLLTGAKKETETSASLKNSLKNRNAFPLMGILLAFGTSISWGLNSFAIVQAGSQLAGPVGNTIRMFIAIGVTSVFGRIFAPQVPIYLPGREILRNLWVFVLEAFLGSCFFLYGLSHSKLALGTSLSALAPVISVPVAVLSGMEKFSIYKAIGVGCVVGGIILLFGK